MNNALGARNIDTAIITLQLFSCSQFEEGSTGRAFKLIIMIISECKLNFCDVSVVHLSQVTDDIHTVHYVH